MTEVSRKLPTRIRRALAAGLVFACLLGGAVQVCRSRDMEQATGRMPYWHSLLVELNRSAERDQSFKAAYKLLCHTLNMLDTIEIMRSVGSRVDVTPELRQQLESAYLIAQARARTAREVQRFQEIQDRYRKRLATLGSAPA